MLIKRKYPVIYLILLWILLMMSGSCAKRIYQTAYPTLNDGEYDTEFPYRNCSRELKHIGDSVRMINAIAYYKSYVFDEKNHILRRDLTPQLIEKQAIENIFFNHATSGTATIILSENQHIVLLTCAHIVDFPDTVISYHTMSDGKPSMFVQSVAVKERQSIYVADLWKIPEVQVLKMDIDTDIAIVGAKLPAMEVQFIPVFNYPFGEAKKLQWGSFVYLLGFPRGYKVITRGIVSDPDRNKNGEFIVDALFNRGCSGGLVLAVKDGVPNFEFMGIAKSAAAEFEYVIRPSSDYDQSKFDLNFPYDGKLFVDYKAIINYGVTHVVSVEEIRQFFKKNYTELYDAGYDFTKFLPE